MTIPNTPTGEWRHHAEPARHGTFQVTVAAQRRSDVALYARRALCHAGGSGDADSDGTLDAKEVRTLALSPAVPITARGFHPGGYGFADEVGVSSSRSHVD